MKSQYKKIARIDKRLFQDLESAFDECLKAKLSTYEIAKKYAPLCVEIVQEHVCTMGHAPELINDCLQKRFEQTWRSVLEDEFWANEDMIIALFEYLQEDFDWE